jgi:peptidyl-tRNA hydrolase
MPLFMDVHTAAGATADAVAEAHRKDLETQGQHDVKYLRYWLDEKQGKIFCLAEAPSAEAAARVHREAHGLVADEIYEVTENT